VNRGWWTITKLRGAPIRLHWTLPLGALVFGRFEFVPGFWLGFFLLILIHELGHALLVLRYRLDLTEIAVHGAGGHCRYAHSGTAFQESAVAWGGVLAQLCLLIATHLAWQYTGASALPYAWQVKHAFTETNLFIMGFNLLPIAPLDGAKAWQIIPMLMARFRKRAVARGPLGQRRSVKDELKALEKLDTQADQPSDKTDRIVRDLISRTTQSKR
jgi:stage IV sporulation protein FB